MLRDTVSTPFFHRRIDDFQFEFAGNGATIIAEEIPDGRACKMCMSALPVPGETGDRRRARRQALLQPDLRLRLHRADVRLRPLRLRRQALNDCSFFIVDCSLASA
jgi:hypothetical protein